MTQKNETKRTSHSQKTATLPTVTVNCGSSNVPQQKTKEDAKKVLYLNRI